MKSTEKKHQGKAKPCSVHEECKSTHLTNYQVAWCVSEDNRKSSGIRYDPSRQTVSCQDLLTEMAVESQYHGILVDTFIRHIKAHADNKTCGMDHSWTQDLTACGGPLQPNTWIPLPAVVLFVHFVAYHHEFISYNDSGGRDWVWRYFTRAPGRDRTLIPFFERFQLKYSEQLLRYSQCIRHLGLVDSSPGLPPTGSMPPLILSWSQPDLTTVINAGLTKYVKHQEMPIKEIAALVATRLCDFDPSRPGVVLMPGPTGTGKTTAAMALVKVLYGEDVWKDEVKRDSVFLRVDLNDFVDRYSISRLIGADPGLATSDEQKGLLIDWIQQLEDSRVPDRPISGILLLDEIEKAGSTAMIITRLMGLFENGHIAGANNNRSYKAAKLIILCGTNAGSAELEACRDHPPQVPNSARDAVRNKIMKVCCGGSDASFARFERIAYFYGFSDLGKRAVMKATVHDRLARAAAVQGRGLFTFSDLADDHPLYERLDSQWQFERSNARSVRNFCGKFEQLAMRVAEKLTKLRSQSTPITTTAPDDQSKLPQCHLVCTNDELQVIDSNDECMSSLPLHMQPLHDAGHSDLHCKIFAWSSSASTPFTSMDPQVMQSLVNVPDNHQRTPLHYAASMCNPSAVRFLCEAGAEIDARDDEGYTPIMRAVESFRFQEDGTRTIRNFSSGERDRSLLCLRIMLDYFVKTLKSAPPILQPHQDGTSQDPKMSNLGPRVDQESDAASIAQDFTIQTLPPTSSQCVQLLAFRDNLPQSSRTALLLAFDVLYQQLSPIGMSSDAPDVVAAPQFDGANGGTQIPQDATNEEGMGMVTAFDLSESKVAWAREIVSFLLPLRYPRSEYDSWRRSQQAAKFPTIGDIGACADESFPTDVDAEGRTLAHRLFQLLHHDQDNGVAMGGLEKDRHQPFRFLRLSHQGEAASSVGDEQEDQCNFLIPLNVLEQCIHCLQCTKRIIGIWECLHAEQQTCLHVHVDCSRAMGRAIHEVARLPSSHNRAIIEVLRFYLDEKFQMLWSDPNFSAEHMQWMVNNTSPSDWGCCRIDSCKVGGVQTGLFCARLENWHSLRRNIFDWFVPARWHAWEESPSTSDLHPLSLLETIIKACITASKAPSSPLRCGDLGYALFPKDRPIVTFATLYTTLYETTEPRKWQTLSDDHEPSDRRRAWALLYKLLHLAHRYKRNRKHVDYWHTVLEKQKFVDCPLSKCNSGMIDLPSDSDGLSSDEEYAAAAAAIPAKEGSRAVAAAAAAPMAVLPMAATPTQPVSTAAAASDASGGGGTAAAAASSAPIQATQATTTISALPTRLNLKRKASGSITEGAPAPADGPSSASSRKIAPKVQKVCHCERKRWEDDSAQHNNHRAECEKIIAGAATVAADGTYTALLDLAMKRGWNPHVARFLFASQHVRISSPRRPSSRPPKPTFDTPDSVMKRLWSTHITELADSDAQAASSMLHEILRQAFCWTSQGGQKRWIGIGLHNPSAC